VATAVFGAADVVVAIEEVAAREQLPTVVLFIFRVAVQDPDAVLTVKRVMVIGQGSRIEIG